MAENSRKMFRCATCNHPCCDHHDHEGKCDWTDCPCEELTVLVITSVKEHPEAIDHQRRRVRAAR